FGYLIFSICIWLYFYSIKKRFSGNGFSTTSFFVILTALIACGLFQSNISRYGYIPFFQASSSFIYSNYLVRWVAFISTISLSFCMPGKEKQRHWFSRKN
ncbi:hypothetical protein, partial [Pseudomonas syringae]|uniref:hypothetical protein n=1 Tax=Pseudomonas syringae TaxID=317 RepID=UPI001E4D3E28